MAEPARSPLTAFLGHVEVAMWAQGVDPEVAQRVLNVVMFGDERGRGAPALPESVDATAEVAYWWSGRAAVLDAAASVAESASEVTLAGQLRDLAMGMRRAAAEGLADAG